MGRWCDHHVVTGSLISLAVQWAWILDFIWFICHSRKVVGIPCCTCLGCVCNLWTMGLDYGHTSQNGTVLLLQHFPNSWISSSSLKPVCRTPLSVSQFSGSELEARSHKVTWQKHWALFTNGKAERAPFLGKLPPLPLLVWNCSFPW